MGFGVRTPFGRPVAWADVRLTGGDQDCVVVACRRLGQVPHAPFDDFLLCVVAQGVVGRVSSPESGCRDSRLAVAAFVRSFLASDEVDVLWRLRKAAAASDARLAASLEEEKEGLLSTLTAVFVGFDGTAYGVSVGDVPLVVVPPGNEPGLNMGVQTLGHERGTALGAGEVRLTGSQAGVIEQWWPTLEDGRTRLESGTSLRVGGGFTRFADTSDPELDGAGCITVRFTGGQVLTSRLVANGGWLVSVFGSRCGVPGDVQGAFGLCCLAERGAYVAGFLGAVLEVDPVLVCSDDGLEQSFAVAGGDGLRSRLAVAAWGARGAAGVFASGGASVEAAVAYGQSGEVELERGAFMLRLGSELDPLDRGLLIAFELDEASSPPGRPLGSRWRRWMLRLARPWMKPLRGFRLGAWWRLGGG